MKQLDALQQTALPGRRLGVLVAASLLVHLAVVYTLQPRTPELTLSVNNQVVQVTLSQPSNTQNTESKPIQKQTTQTQAAEQATQSSQQEIKPQRIEPVTNETDVAPVTESPQSQTTSEPQVIHQSEQTEASSDVITQVMHTPEAKDPQADLMSLEEVNARVMSKLDNDIRQYFTYPLMAKKRGWEGVVKLDIEVDSQGKIASVVIRQSSGHKLLDKAAQKTLERIGHIGNAASWLGGRSLNTTVPVKYELTNG